MALAIAVLLPLARAQAGKCTELDISSYATRLPKGAACSVALAQVTLAGAAEPTPTPEELQGSLETLCNVDCGRSLAEFFFAYCEDPIAGNVLSLWCTPQKGDRYCRSSSPELIDSDLFNDLSSCVEYNSSSPSCPAGCESALNAFVDEVGCCYTFLYNVTETLEFYVATGIINETQAYYLSSITNFELWDACNRDLTTICTGEPYPGKSILVAGTCTQDDIDVFAERELSASCQTSLLEFYVNPEAPSDEILEEVCSEGCGGAFAEFYDETCQAAAASTYLRAYCYRSPNAEVGSYCRQAVGAQFENAPFFVEVGARCLIPFDPADGCPVGCAEALQELSSQLGCCYQTIYNDTTILDLFTLQDLIDFGERIFFGGVGGSQATWDICQVPLVEKCTENPISSVLKFAPSIVLVVLVAMVTTLLY